MWVLENVEAQVLSEYIGQPMHDSNQVAILWNFKITVARIDRGKQVSLLVMLIGLAPSDS